MSIVIVADDYDENRGTRFYCKFTKSYITTSYILILLNSIILTLYEVEICLLHKPNELSIANLLYKLILQ